MTISFLETGMENLKHRWMDGWVGAWTNVQVDGMHEWVYALGRCMDR